MFNTIGYIQIESSDPEGSVEFFRRVLGWEIKSSAQDYAEFRPPAGAESISGGFIGVGALPQPQLAYISVASIDAALAQIEAQGGAVLKPRTQISEEIGWYAQFREPGGAAWGLYELPAGHPDAKH